jgi:CheY-like chemotaxis protein
MRSLQSILLVDDDETTNFLNKFFVKQLDPELEVEIATNGREALDYLKGLGDDHPGGMIVLDTNMPIVNGWEFLDTFQASFREETHSKWTIIMLTALNSEEATARAMSHPLVNDTAQKPLSDLKFRALINKHF